MLECIDPLEEFLTWMQWGFGGAFAMLVLIVIVYGSNRHGND